MRCTKLDLCMEETCILSLVHVNFQTAERLALQCFYPRMAIPDTRGFWPPFIGENLAGGVRKVCEFLTPRPLEVSLQGSRASC